MERIVGSTSSIDRAGDRAVVPEGDRRVLIGHVVGPHGLRGQLRVRVVGGAGDAASSLTHVVLRPVGADAPTASGSTHVVESLARGRRGELRLTLAGVEGRAAAEALRGCGVWVEPDQLAELPAGEFYAFQLVGCRVEGEDGSAVGRVREVWESGGRDLLLVEDAAGRRHLIPADSALLREVDLAVRRIVVDLLPGLLDAPVETR